MINLKPCFLPTLLISLLLCVPAWGGNGNRYDECLVRTDYAPDPAYRQDYTILVYMDGSNLEQYLGAATNDILEMQAALAGSGASVTFAVETGGSPRWHLPELEDSYHARFPITSQGIGPVTDMPRRNMGSPNTLADFLNYGILTYPARHYLLIFWNHGNGSVTGFGKDELSGSDSLTLYELSQGLSRSCAQPGQFACIGFDACLMSTLETAAAISDYAGYLLASQEEEPSGGWDYQMFSGLAGQNPDSLSIPELDLCLAVEQEYQSKGHGRYTISLTDLGYMDDWDALLDSAIARWDNSGSLYTALAENRTDMPGYGAAASSATLSYRGPDMADLSAWMEVLLQYDPERMAQFHGLLEQTVVDNHYLGYPYTPSGLSIFLPGSRRQDQQEFSDYLRLPLPEPYLDAIQYCYEQFAPTDAPSVLNPVSPAAGTDTGRWEFLIPDGMEEPLLSAYLNPWIALDRNDGSGGQALCSLGTQSDGVIVYSNRIETAFDGFWPCLGTQPLHAIETYDSLSHRQLLIPVLLSRDGLETLYCMNVQYDKKEDECVILSAAPVTEDGQPGKSLTSLQAGDILTPAYPLTSDYRQGPGANAYLTGQPIVVTSPELLDLSYHYLKADYQMQLQIEGSDL